MVGSVFRQAVREATGIGWEEWIARLQRETDPSWSHEQMKNHICETWRLPDEWGEGWLRMAWKRPEWERPSRLQIYFLSASGGKTTVAIHQEMPEDVYIRELMRRHWEKTLLRIRNETADRQ